MILFKKEFIPKILNGTKTQTRRLWKKPRVKVGSIQQCKTDYYGKPFASILVKSIYKERLGCISGKSIIAEGFDSLGQFVKRWKEINGSYDADSMPYVVEFELVK